MGGEDYQSEGPNRSWLKRLSKKGRERKVFEKSGLKRPKGGESVKQGDRNLWGKESGGTIETFPLQGGGGGGNSGGEELRGAHLKWPYCGGTNGRSRRKLVCKRRGKGGNPFNSQPEWWGQ